MDFDFNLILVPATLVFFLLWLLDKLVLKQRATKGKGHENLIIAWAYDFWPVLAIVLFVRSFLYEPFNIPSESMKPNLEIGDFILVNKFNYGVRLPLLNTKIIPVGEPKAGDIAVFRYPDNPNISYIKRVIAVGGDTVKIENGVITVNGQTYTQTPIAKLSLTIDGHALDAQSYHEQVGDKKYIIQQVLAEQSNEQQQLAVEQRNQLMKYQRECGKTIQCRSPKDGTEFVWHGIVTGFPTPKQSVEFIVPEKHYFMMGDNRDQSADGREWGFVPEENLVGRAFFIWMHKEPGFNLPSLNRNGKID